METRWHLRVCFNVVPCIEQKVRFDALRWTLLTDSIFIYGIYSNMGSEGGWLANYNWKAELIGMGPVWKWFIISDWKQLLVTSRVVLWIYSWKQQHLVCMSVCTRVYKSKKEQGAVINREMLGPHKDHNTHSEPLWSLFNAKISYSFWNCLSARLNFLWWTDFGSAPSFGLMS